MYLLKQQTLSLGAGNIVGGRRNLARSQFRGQTLRGGNTCCVNTRDPVASPEIQIGKYKQIHKYTHIKHTYIHKYTNTPHVYKYVNKHGNLNWKTQIDIQTSNIQKSTQCRNTQI